MGKKSKRGGNSKSPAQNEVDDELLAETMAQAMAQAPLSEMELKKGAEDWTRSAGGGHPTSAAPTGGGGPEDV